MELHLPKVGAMKQIRDPYVISFEVEPCYKGKRHHWMISRAQNPEELVSWGHEPTRVLAEAAAEKELQDLSSGVTRGGQVIRTIKPFTHRIAEGWTGRTTIPGRFRLTESKWR